MIIVTLGTPTFVATASWVHPGGHAASDWRFNLYAQDILIEQVGGSFGTPMASGTTGDFSYPLLPLDNHQTAILTISFKDAVSGVWNESAPWELLTDWIPPDPPTDLVYVSDTLHGMGRLSWTNGNDTAMIRVEMRQRSSSGAPGPWLQQWQGTARESIGLPEQAPRRDYDFRVTALSLAGVPSSPAMVSGRLQFIGNRLGVWLMALDGENSVVLGYPYDMSTTKFTQIDDIVGIVTLGSKEESTAEGITDFVTATQQWWLPAVFRSGTVIYGDDTRLALWVMKRAGQPVLYKDPRGHVFKAMLRQMWEQDEAGGNLMVGFELRQTRYDGPPMVDLSATRATPMSVLLS